jgi:hypothetical protein
VILDDLGNAMSRSGANEKSMPNRCDVSQAILGN